MNSKKFKRVKLRLKDYDYAQNGLYFITLCVHKKWCLFGDIENDILRLYDAGKMVASCWDDLPQRFKNITMHDFVVMPNHFHGIIEIMKEDEILGNIIGAFKSIVTNEYIKGVKHNNWTPFDKILWQRNYYEHIIRNDKSHQKISDYIQYNPAKWCDDKYYQP